MGLAGRFRGGLQNDLGDSRNGHVRLQWRCGAGWPPHPTPKVVGPDGHGGRDFASILAHRHGASWDAVGIFGSRPSLGVGAAYSVDDPTHPRDVQPR